MIPRLKPVKTDNFPSHRAPLVCLSITLLNNAASRIEPHVRIRISFLFFFQLAFRFVSNRVDSFLRICFVSERIFFFLLARFQVPFNR